MTEVNFISDIHRFAPHELKCSANLSDPYTYCLGDYIDLKSVLNKKLGEAVSEVYNAQNFASGRYVLGNHEMVGNVLDLSKFQTQIVKNFGYWKVLMIHGHQVCWTVDHFLTWIRKHAGSSKWKWHSLKLIKCFEKQLQGQYKVKPGTSSKMSKSVIDRCVALMEKNECNCIVFGHTHTNILKDFVHDEFYRIINIPRGATKIIF